MINRYAIQEIQSIWEDQFKFEKFLEVEVSLLEELEKLEIIKDKISSKVSKCKVDIQRIYEIEKETRHDVIAFCSSISEQLSTNEGKFFHYGVTSSDIIDTALSLQVKASLDIVIRDFEILLVTLQEQSNIYQDQMCMGRSHGIWAEPMSFGQKLLGHTTEFRRRLKDLKSFYENELTGQISGAVGNYTILTPEIEERVLKKLGLRVEPVSTQVIPRDRVAKLVSIFSLYACALERFCVEIRHLQHSDVGEVYEGFAKGQKGSSTMPHKKNPISCENLTGIARTLRSHMGIAFENTILWHERDISHSSAERLYLPDAFGLMSYSLRRLNTTVKNLVIDKERMLEKVQSTFKHLSSFTLHEMIKASDLTREEVYKRVQDASFESSTREQYFENLKASFNSERELASIEAIRNSDDQSIFGRHTSEIFKRAKL